MSSSLPSATTAPPLIAAACTKPDGWAGVRIFPLTRTSSAPLPAPSRFGVARAAASAGFPHVVIGTTGGNPGLQTGEEAGAPRSGAMIVP